MDKQHFVGQYFINNVETGNVCEQEVGECIWQDSEDLLCAVHAEDTCGQAFNSILLIPRRLASKIKWYTEFDEFEDAVAGDSSSALDVTMTSEEHDEVLSLRVPECYMELSEILWPVQYDRAGLCIATLAWRLKENPDVAVHLVGYIYYFAPKNKTRKQAIEAIAKMISDAALTAHEIAELLRVTHSQLNNNEFPFDDWLHTQDQTAKIVH